MTADGLDGWIGRTEDRTDMVALAPFAGLAATLDYGGAPESGAPASSGRAAPPWRDGEMPPLGHWLCFQPAAAQGEIGEDGHPRRGGFLPPIALPRRMWAGSRLRFLAPVRIGDTLSRRSTIADITRKNGQSGALAFVTVRHALSNAAGPVIEEVQDIVYREAAPPGAQAPVPAGPAIAPNPDWSRTVTPDPVLLFRFSALTFNGHRIHYDRPYAREVEGYDGLVVHGPLTATLLMDLFLRARPGARVTGFSFRGRRPLLDTRPFVVSARETPNGAALSAIDADGQLAMSAEVEAGE